MKLVEPTIRTKRLNKNPENYAVWVFCVNNAGAVFCEEGFDSRSTARKAGQRFIEGEKG